MAAIDRLICSSSDWQAQSVEDSLKWHRANLGDRLTPAREVDFRAAYAAGWRDAFTTFRVQGVIPDPR